MKTKDAIWHRMILAYAALALLAAPASALAGDTFIGAKVGDTVNVRSGLTLLNNATLIGITSSNIAVLSGLDLYSLPVAGTVVIQARMRANIAVKEGDRVDVKSDPLVILNHALLTGMTSSNVTVATSFETITLPLSNTVVRPAEEPSEAQVYHSSQLTISNRISAGDPQGLKAAPESLVGVGDPIVQQILGKYSSDPHYGDSVSFYQSMMGGIQSGSVQLDDLVNQAEQVLGTLDQYEPERAKDPEFEGNISTLRDFVNRAKAGEKVEIVR